VNRIGLGILALVLLCGVGAVFVFLGGGGEPERSGDADGRTRGAVAPTSAGSEGSGAPRGQAQLAGDTTTPGQPGSDSSASPSSDRVVAGPSIPAGLPGGTQQTLQGNVLASSRPLPGAQVQFTTRDGETLCEDTTDERGSFELEAPYPIEDGRVLVQARGYAPLMTGPHAIRAGERRFVGNMMLTRGSVLAGQVTDPTGVGVAGASVELTQTVMSAPNLFVQTATTDHQGMFRFPDAPLGQVTVAARATGFGGAKREVLHQSDGDRTTLPLGVSRTLEVLVRDGRGDPVPGASVRARPHSPTSPSETATTDADGLALLSGLGSEIWDVQIDAPGFRTGVRDRVTAPSRVEIDLTGWPSILGVVVLPNGDPPPPGTTVKALSANARGDFADVGFAKPTEVAADGSFDLRDLRPGSYVVEAVAPGWAPSRSSPQRLTLNRDAQGVRVELHSGAALEIQVVGPVEEGSKGASEAPIPSASCELWAQAPPATVLWRTDATPFNPGIGPVLSTTTDSDGVARFEHVGGGNYWCLARRPGMLPAVLGPFVVGRSGVSRLGPLRLDYGGRLKGTVAGLPEGGAEALITLFGQDAALQNAPVVIPTDDSGRWSSPLLPPGRYRITARLIAGSPPRARTASDDRTLARGETVEVALELD